MTRPHNERPGHPGWCHQDSESTIGRHVSQAVRVGERRKTGEAAAWLAGMNGGPPRMNLSVAHMAWARIDLSLDDTARLRDGLTELLQAAGYEERPS